MSLSPLPLSYCTNVHPGRNLAEVLDGLKQYTVPVRQEFGHPLAAGLWLAAPVISELLSTAGRLPDFARTLASLGLPCYTLNAFPYGDFHSVRVKEKVYLPDWSQAERASYSLDCARVLSVLLPEGADGSISTVPLGFKQLSHPEDFFDQCIGRLLETATALDRLHSETGRLIRLAIEPEPLCLLETTPETLSFFERLFALAETRGLLEIARRHLGVCYDVCHQAVEFESIAQSIEAIDRAGIRFNKIHITCVIHNLIELKSTGQREEFFYTEPQTIAKDRLILDLCPGGPVD
jgi:sugar phosphate isomerase/epimerase